MSRRTSRYPPMRSCLCREIVEKRGNQFYCVYTSSKGNVYFERNGGRFVVAMKIASMARNYKDYGSYVEAREGLKDMVLSLSGNR